MYPRASNSSFELLSQDCLSCGCDMSVDWGDQTFSNLSIPSATSDRSVEFGGHYWQTPGRYNMTAKVTPQAKGAKVTTVFCTINVVGRIEKVQCSDPGE